VDGSRPRCSIVFNDEWPAYNALGQHFTHSRVRHTSGEYVIGDWHTNTTRGFFRNLPMTVNVQLV
jgi:ISXO2-like transposase domain